MFADIPPNPCTGGDILSELTRFQPLTSVKVICVPAVVLKRCPPFLSVVITEIMNHSLITGSIPKTIQMGLLLNECNRDSDY